MPPRRINPATDVEIETICLKCLSKDPAARYASAEELAADLERWIDDKPILARPIGFLDQSWRWCRRQPALASALAASIILLFALVIGTSIAGFRIHRAEIQAARHRQEGLLGDVRTLRLGADLGERSEGLRKIREAVALGGSQEFRQRARNELLALLGRTDVLFETQPQLNGSPDPWLNLLDPAFGRLATVVGNSNLSVRAVEDGRELNRFRVPGTPVLRLDAFSPDGRFLALSQSDGWSVWEIESGKRLFATNGTNLAYCFAPHRPLLILQDRPSELCLIELPSARVVDRVPVDTGGDPDYPHRWSHIALSPDGQMLAAARARSRIIELVDLERGNVRRRQTNRAPCTAMAWSQDGQMLAVAMENGRIPIWRGSLSGRLMYLSAKSSPAHNLAFNAEGTLLAAAHADRMVQLISLTALRSVFEFRCDNHQIGFDAAGMRLGPMRRGPEFGWLELQPPSEFQQFTTAHTGVQLIGCQFSPDSRLVATGTLTNVLFCDLTKGNSFIQIPSFRLTAFTFDPRGEAMFAAGTPGLHRWSMNWREPAWLEMSDMEVVFNGAGWRAFTFSAQGDWFAAANVRSNAAYLFDSTLTNQLVEVGPHRGADAVAVSPDGRWLATGSSTDRQVKVWDANSGNEVLTLAVGATPRPVFSPDGKWLVAYGASFHLYATGSWQPAPQLPVAEGQPLMGAAAFSPDGRILAAVCDMFTIQLFDLEKWQSLGVLRPLELIRMSGLAFSPDGTLLAASGTVARMRIWDLRATRERLAEFGLDWELPPLPPAATTNSEKLRVTFAR